MNRYVSDPIPLPPRSPEGPAFNRAELVFHDVDPAGPSYEARIYVHAEPTDVAEGEQPAGVFTIFGHGGCFGDEGHCDPVAERQDPYDFRPPDGIPLQLKNVDVTAAIGEIEGESIIVTVIPVEAGEEGPVPSDALHFTQLRLLTYAD